MGNYVFVYGTLRQGASNHSFMEHAHLVTSEAYLYGTLYDTEKGYPALVTGGYDRVIGEIYNVTEQLLEKLDRLETFFGDNMRIMNMKELFKLYMQVTKVTKRLYMFIRKTVQMVYRKLIAAIGFNGNTNSLNFVKIIDNHTFVKHNNC